MRACFCRGPWRDLNNKRNTLSDGDADNGCKRPAAQQVQDAAGRRHRRTARLPLQPPFCFGGLLRLGPEGWRTYNSSPSRSATSWSASERQPWAGACCFCPARPARKYVQKNRAPRMRSHSRFPPHLRACPPSFALSLTPSPFLAHARDARRGWMGGFVKDDNRFGYEKWIQGGCIAVSSSLTIHRFFYFLMI